MFLDSIRDTMPSLIRIDKKFDIRAFYSAFKFQWDKNFVFSGESHEPWEIVFVTDGRVEVTEDEKIYRLGAGDMILHAPWEFHRIRSSEGTSPCVMVMAFLASGELPSKLKNGIFSLDRMLFGEYLEVFESIYKVISKKSENEYCATEAAALLTSFLIRLSKKLNDETQPISTVSAREYKSAVFAMNEGICENLTLTDIAQSCNVSVSYLKLLFDKYAGVSPKSYYSKLRIQHACELLKSGMSVTATADAMNFSSPNYFCVFFKRHMGISPFEYQKDKI